MHLNRRRQFFLIFALVSWAHTKFGVKHHLCLIQPKRPAFLSSHFGPFPHLQLNQPLGGFLCISVFNIGPQILDWVQVEFDGHEDSVLLFTNSNILINVWGCLVEGRRLFRWYRPRFVSAFSATLRYESAHDWEGQQSVDAVRVMHWNKLG